MSEESDSEEAITIMILGNSQVGKTSFILRFVENTFQSTYLSTVGIDFKVKNINLGDKEYKLILYDTAGQERYKSLAPNLIKKACGIILVYDITNKSSFDSIPEIMEKLKEEKGNIFPMVLVGNKIDLEQRREIEKEKGELLAEKNGIDFFEVSNKEGINIQEAGLAIVHKILEKRRKDSIVETERSSKVSSLTYYSKYSNVDNDCFLWPL
jgi:small GTP-binding protein